MGSLPLWMDTALTPSKMTSPELSTKDVWRVLGCNFCAKKSSVQEQPATSGAEPIKAIGCERCLRENEQLVNVIFTDECSVVMENHSKITFHDMWEQPKVKGHPKHPRKVYVWAGVSKTLVSTIFLFLGPSWDSYVSVSSFLMLCRFK